MDHPSDPGGATNMGITIGTLRAWRGANVTELLRVSDTLFRETAGFGMASTNGARYAEVGCDYVANALGPRNFASNGGSAVIVGSKPG